MKNTLFTLLMILAVLVIIGCKAGEKISIKTVEQKIAADINRMLEEYMIDMGLSGVKLKKAPKNQNAAFMGIVTYLSGSDKIESEILVNYESNVLTWWSIDDPDDISVIIISEPVKKTANENAGSSGTQSKSVSGTENKQSSNSETTETLSKVEQRGSTFTTFDSRGNRITNISNPNKELVGWGKDFFVIRSGTTFITYDTRCRQISTISIGGATTATVENEYFTVKVGSSNQKYNKNCKRI